MSAQGAGSSYVPLLVVGDSRRAAIAQALRGVLAEVLGEWITKPDVRIDVRTRPEFRAQCKERRFGRAHAMTFADSHERACYCFIDDKLLQGALDAMARNAVCLGGFSSLAADVQCDVHESLAARLASALRLSLESPAEACSLPDLVIEEALQRWIFCAIEGAGAHIAIALHPLAVERLSPLKPPASRPAEPLAARKAAIRANSVALQAILGEAEIGCGDLTRLAEGDVLVLDQDLSATVKLQGADGVVVSMAQLGRSGDRLALHLV